MKYGKFVGIYGAKGPAWMKVNDRSAGIEVFSLLSPKFLTAETVEAILERTDAQTGDIIFFGAGAAKGTVSRCNGRAASENRP